MTLSPEETCNCCGELEDALSEYQRILEKLVPDRYNMVEYEKPLSSAFLRVRRAFSPLEPLLLKKKVKIRKRDSEGWQNWDDVPTFRGVRTIEDFNALDVLTLQFDMSRNNVRLELQGYFECIDSVRREAERQIQGQDTGDLETSHNEQAQASTGSPRKKPESIIKEPTPREMQIYRTHFATGWTQKHIAMKMEAETGLPCCQSFVSRAIGKVREFIKAANVLPDLPPSGRSRHVATDPQKLDRRYGTPDKDRDIDD